MYILWGFGGFFSIFGGQLMDILDQWQEDWQEAISVSYQAICCYMYQGNCTIK
jgi:hypothetical protein